MPEQAKLFESNAPLLQPGERFRLAQSDAVEWLGSLPSASADLMLTDPAYCSLEKHRAVGTTTRLTVEWFPVVQNDYFHAFFREAFRVLKPNSHCYVMCDQETMFAIKPMGEAAGFKFWKPLVWDKMKIGMGYHFRARCEFILFFEKGKRKLHNLGTPDVLEFARIRDGYPTEKPVELLEVLVQQSSSEGEIVVDPFMGSGSTGESALRNGRRFLGSDLTEKSVLVARERLVGLTQ